MLFLRRNYWVGNPQATLVTMVTLRFKARFWRKRQKCYVMCRFVNLFVMLDKLP